MRVLGWRLKHHFDGLQHWVSTICFTSIEQYCTELERQSDFWTPPSLGLPESAFSMEEKLPPRLGHLAARSVCPHRLLDSHESSLIAFCRISVQLYCSLLASRGQVCRASVLILLSRTSSSSYHPDNIDRQASPSISYRGTWSKLGMESSMFELGFKCRLEAKPPECRPNFADC